MFAKIKIHLYNEPLLNKNKVHWLQVPIMEAIYRLTYRSFYLFYSQVNGLYGAIAGETNKTRFQAFWKCLNPYLSLIELPALINWTDPFWF